MIIREVKETDVQDLSSLMNQFGYPTTEQEMRVRYEKIKNNPHYFTIVAEVDDTIVGIVGLFRGHFYERNEVSVRIVAFVVDERYRKIGIGKQLIAKAEKWAKDVGALGIGLTSGKRDEREVAHRFYKRLGYVDSSIGYVKKFD
ncbi:GNAT family N-acetyltransferase [Bacillus sp. AFS017336]|uniref:GNAT family N-acetyltransferase n=1 Tax=Bacillus sp. AFS017336 TaxID=2033489 RepID=UPI000BEF59A9|nr:GNAT family N-acetyltransferase [Bacillus sp. AFS017336]PEL13259.1 GNAT family N-acetyltransferase [Bacillus sp. AFS017336]